MIVLAAMGLSLVACGSSDGGGDGVASLGTTRRHGQRRPNQTTRDRPAADADGAALEAPEDIEEAMALFQECMEDHGVEMPGEASWSLATATRRSRSAAARWRVQQRRIDGGSAPTTPTQVTCR